MKTAYLDNAATTRLHPDVRDVLHRAQDAFGNPSSLHAAGRAARKIVEDARERIAGCLGADPREIVFASCATEANNLALAGRSEVVTSAVEHSSVIEATPRGTRIAVDGTGRIATIPEASFLSIMAANNEVGTVQPIAEIAKRKKGLLHVDAAQALGKIPVSVEGIDLLTISAHKIHGPKGIGALYVRRGTPLHPQIVGGGQEFGRRAGTENVALAAAFARAVELAVRELPFHAARMERLRARLREGLEAIPDIRIHGHGTERLPSILNVSFEGVEGEAMILSLDAEGVYVSTGSACASMSLEPSPVLRAMGIAPEVARTAIRFSVAADTADEEVDLALEKVPRVVERLRRISAAYRK